MAKKIKEEVVEEIKEEVVEKIKEEVVEEIKEEVTKDLSQSEESASEESKANKKIEPTKIESLDSKLKRFKRQSSGIISEVKKREAYDKPSVKRKKKSKEARRHRRNGRFNSSKW